jgi:hypothetical protein
MAMGRWMCLRALLLLAIGVLLPCACSAALSASSAHSDRAPRPSSNSGVRSASPCSASQLHSHGLDMPVSYDVVILGAGAAGSLLTANLAAEFPSKQFLLVEAGVVTGNGDNPDIR